MKTYIGRTLCTNELCFDAFLLRGESGQCEEGIAVFENKFGLRRTEELVSECKHMLD